MNDLKSESKNGKGHISKLGLSHYLKLYNETLEPLKDKHFTILEIGIAEGDSLCYWRDNYPKATVVGLDINTVSIEDTSGRIKCYAGEQQNCELLSQIAAEHAPDGFDIVIDDGSHIGHYTRISFWHLFKNHLKPSGFYFIEDWGTGYWNMYPDGRAYHPKTVDLTWLEKKFSSLENSKFILWNSFLLKVVKKLRFMSMKKTISSHNRGMVGFVKELVDECGMPDATDARRGSPPERKSLIDWMRVSTGIVLVKRN